MSSRVRGGCVALALVLLAATFTALAGPAGTARDLATPSTADAGDGTTAAGVEHPRPTLLLQGHPSVRVDKNCYFPEEALLITLKNVGAGRLLYDVIPNYEIVSPTLGTVRMILTGWTPADFILRPGESKFFIWTQQWLAVDAGGNPIHVNEFVPEGEYRALVKVLSGSSVITIGEAPFIIGACNVQVSAGEDAFVAEGETFTLAPDVTKTGPGANITSVSWDTNPTLDGNGDGDATNDADLVGLTPDAVFGDDGVYPITLNVRGFLPNQTVGVKQDVVLTIDSSGSMQWNDPFDMRKEAAKSYVDLLVPNDRAAVVDFDESAILVNDHHLSTDYAQVKGDIDTIDSFGGTFLVMGLNAALDELQFFGSPDNLGVIIFLTDAESIFEDDDILIPLAITRAVDLGVRIYTIGLNVPPTLMPLMQKIADDTGGKFYPTPDPGTLVDIY
ncbi:MAG TPA: vWA domain-containing protein, partial [Thermoplasmata archaeon]|nr:vWA domain-containing protein [Thermoplasmata archaeon]